MPFNGGPPPLTDGPRSGARDERRDSDLSDAFLSPEAYRAAQAVEFIAEHLRNDDEYVQVQYEFTFLIGIYPVEHRNISSKLVGKFRYGRKANTKKEKA